MEVAVSPWNFEFVQFLVVSAACVGGGWFFSQGDQLVANKFFSEVDRDAYSSAGLFARTLPTVSGPLLAVLFTHRSGRQHHHGGGLRDQLQLLGLFAFGLCFGAIPFTG